MLGELDRNLLQQIQGILEAGFHAGCDDRVAVLFGRELHQEGQTVCPSTSVNVMG